MPMKRLIKTKIQEEIKNKTLENQYALCEMCTRRNPTFYEIVNKIFEEWPYARILGVEKNNLGEEQVIVVSSPVISFYGYHNTTIDIRLINNSQDFPPSQKYIFSTVYRDPCDESSLILRIQDIRFEPHNNGNGSIAMNALIKYVKEIGFKKINGYFFPDDPSVANDLEKFYKKFGFEVDRKTGHLELKL